MIKYNIEKIELNILKKYNIEDINNYPIYKTKYEKKDFLYLEGLPLEYIHIIIKGKLKIFHSDENGKSILFAFLTKGNIIGEVELFLNNPVCISTVQAIEEVETIAIPINITRKLMKEYPNFTLSMANKLADKLNNSNKTTSLLTLYSVENRLSSYIYWTNDKGIFYENMETLAQLLGCSYRQMRRAFVKLCEEKILIKNGKFYRILDSEKLHSRSCDCYNV